jgi:hypothetical protein
MSELQTRHFNPLPATSGLPPRKRCHARPKSAMNGVVPAQSHYQSDRWAAEFSRIAILNRWGRCQGELLQDQLRLLRNAVGLDWFTAFHHMKFDPGGNRTRW